MVAVCSSGGFGKLDLPCASRGDGVALQFKAVCGQVLATVLGHSDLCVPSGCPHCIGNSSGHQRRRAFSDLGKHQHKKQEKRDGARGQCGRCSGQCCLQRLSPLLSSWEIPVEIRTPRIEGEAWGGTRSPDPSEPVECCWGDERSVGHAGQQL